MGQRDSMNLHPPEDDRQDLSGRLDQTPNADFDDPSAGLANPNVEAGNSDAMAVVDFEDRFSQLTRWDTSSECIGGCGIAGAIYALLVSFYFTFQTSSLILMLFLWPVAMIAGFLVGAFSAILVSAVLMTVNASLRWPLSSRWFGFITGGLAGFLPFVPLLSLRLHPQKYDFMMFIFWGPFLAMTLGHFWSYCLTDRVISEHNARHSTIKFTPQIGDRNARRFGITDLMILTGWMAVGFASFSLLPKDARGIFLEAYLIAQLASAIAGLVFLRLRSLLKPKASA